jgi:hypothetical protein
MMRRIATWLEWQMRQMQPERSLVFLRKQMYLMSKHGVIHEF